MSHLYASREDPIGCTLIGCLGGGLLGLFGGGLFLVVLAVVIAISRPDPTLVATPTSGPDLRVTVDEAFLNRFIEQPAGGSIRANILPGNQVELVADTVIQALGLNVPVQVTGRFEIQLADQALTVRLVDTQVQGVELPPEMLNIFESEIPLINQNLAMMTDQVSRTLGTPVTFTGLSTNENQIQIEIRENR